MTTRDEISLWFDAGVEVGNDFMIVVCDTFDHEDYPVYTSAANFGEDRAKFNGRNMQRIMEVYDLSMDKNTQLDEHRANHPPT